MLGCQQDMDEKSLCHAPHRASMRLCVIVPNVVNLLWSFKCVIALLLLIDKTRNTINNVNLRSSYNVNVKNQKPKLVSGVQTMTTRRHCVFRKCTNNPKKKPKAQVQQQCRCCSKHNPFTTKINFKVIPVKKKQWTVATSSTSTMIQFDCWAQCKQTSFKIDTKFMWCPNHCWQKRIQPGEQQTKI